MNKYEIAVLAEDFVSKRRIWEAWGQTNTYGRSNEELTKIEIGYHLAEAELREAYRALEQAKG